MLDFAPPFIPMTEETSVKEVHSKRSHGQEQSLAVSGVEFKRTITFSMLNGAVKY
jgi:hypothetical protein